MANENNLEKITLLLKILIGLIIVIALVLCLYFNQELYDGFNKAVFNIDNNKTQ
jgi:hypothetical protein